MPRKSVRRKQRRSGTRRSKTHRSKGGVFVAKGSYGCTYRPAIPCKGAVSKPGTISKLMDKSEADKEMEAVPEFIKTLPDATKYFLFPTEMCEPDEKSQNYQDRKKTCTGDVLRARESSLLILEDGGNNLDMVLNNNPDAEKLFVGFRKIFEAVKMLSVNHIGHFDIKGGNITCTADYNMRLIDFGNARQINQQIDLRVFGALYPGVWPDTILTFRDNFTGSPEDIKYLHNIDIYSLGMLLHRCCVILGTGLQRLKDLIKYMTTGKVTMEEALKIYDKFLDGI